MWWSKKPQAPAAEPVSNAEQKRLKKKCVAPLKALQSCKRANPDLPLAYARLESRAIECYAEVLAPQQALAFKECYLQKAEEQEHPDYAANDCQMYVAAMQEALKQRGCDPLQ